MLVETYHLYDSHGDFIKSLHDFDDEFLEYFTPKNSDDNAIELLAKKYNAYTVTYDGVSHGEQFGDENNRVVYQREL